MSVAAIAVALVLLNAMYWTKPSANEVPAKPVTPVLFVALFLIIAFMVPSYVYKVIEGLVLIDTLKPKDPVPLLPAVEAATATVAGKAVPIELG